MENKIIVIVGQGGSGKSTRANTEALAIGGVIKHVLWNDFFCKFGLANTLENNPDVVIVEEVPQIIFRSNSSFFKNLACGESFIIRKKYHKKVREVILPKFIFTVLSRRKKFLLPADIALKERINLIKLG